MSIELGGPIAIASPSQQESMTADHPTLVPSEPLAPSEPSTGHTTMPSRVTFQQQPVPTAALSNTTSRESLGDNLSGEKQSRSRSGSVMTSASTDDFSVISDGSAACVDDKRIKDWRKRFETDEDEELVCTHGCALVVDIMVQGRLYMTNKRVNFRSNIIGIVTKRSFPISSILAITPKNVAGFIPNAIEILHTSPSSPKDKPSETYKSLLTTLPKRDHTLAILIGLWRKEAPEAYEKFIVGEGAALAAYVGKENARERSASVSSRKLDESKGAVDGTGDEDSDDSSAEKASKPAAVSGSEAAQKGGGSTGGDGSTNGPHPATTADTPELEKQALHTRLPSEPEKVFELLYQHDTFLKDLWKDQGMFNVEMQPWAGREREFTYSRPLGGKVGSTRCESHEKLIHPEGTKDWWGVEGTTRTPGVPGGKSFHTRSKTVFTYAEGGGTIMHVTFQVEWTSKSMLKGMINGQAESGQIAWNELLAKNLREYIKQHPEEFPFTGNAEGVDDAAEEVSAASTAGSTTRTSGEPSAAPATTKSAASRNNASSAEPPTEVSSSMDDFMEWLSDDPIRAAMAGLLALLFLAYLFTLVRRLFTGETVSIKKSRLKVLEAYEVAHLARLAREGKNIIGSGAKKVGA